MIYGTLVLALAALGWWGKGSQSSAGAWGFLNAQGSPGLHEWGQRAGTLGVPGGHTWQDPQCLLAPAPQCLSTSGLLGTVEKGQPRAPGMRPEGMCLTWEAWDAG